MKHRFLPLFGLLAFLLSACQPVQAPAGAQAAAPAELILATTTSTQDSGLLDAILPVFEAEAQASVGVVAVGTGQALQLGTDCNADVVLVHARAREEAFLEAGDG
ncbi:MAG: substrate-binding domain-containing protein, partial [Caldilinea sp.]